MSPRSKKAVRLFLKKTFTYSVICLLVATAVIGSIIIWTFEVKLKRWPVMIFGAPTTIKAGNSLKDIRLITRLTRLGYLRNDSRDPVVGEWRQTGSELKIFLRYCPFAGNKLIEGPVTISLDDDIVKSIRLMRSSQDVRSFELEPELLGIVPAKGRSPEICIPIRLDQAPPLLIDSILLTEDNRFYSHNGIDLISIYRALLSNLQAGRYVQGASTITQQLIRMTLLNPEKTLWRKSVEIVLSLGADAIYSKNSILEAYLNRVYLGQFGAMPIIGVSEGARNFFGKSVDQIDVSECALIAAIIRAPNVINPFKHPARTQARRNMILGLLFKHGKISKDTYEEAISKPVQMFKPGTPVPRVGSFIEMVKQQILNEKTLDNAPRNFLATSMDPALQAEVELKLRKLGETGQQGYAVVANPRSGCLLAYVTPSSEKWDGSGGDMELFSPMALAPAFTPQQVNAPLYTLASQITTPGTDNRRLAFAEAFRTDRRGLIRKILEVIGTEKVVNALGEFKVEAKVDGPNILIAPMTPLEVVQSYSALANLGSAGTINCRRPTALDNTDHASSHKQIVVSIQPAVLFIINSLIRDPQGFRDMNDGPQKLLMNPSSLFASDNFGLWSIAYHRTAISLIRIPSSTFSAKHARKVALEILPAPDIDQGRDFMIPPGLVFRKLCVESGLRATSTCPHVNLLPFLSGTQPDEWCTLRHEADHDVKPVEKPSVRPK